jgi:hypothetical protein
MDHTLIKGSAPVGRSTGDVGTSARTAQPPHAAVKQAVSSPWVELLERVGYIARGVLYVVMGALAVGLALGHGGKATDQSGSLAALAGGTFGKVLLLAFVVGLAAYSLWGFVRAIFDPLNRGDHAAGIAERLGFAWSGFAYAGLALFALELFVGIGKASQDSTRSQISRILAYPAGEWAVTVIGLVSMVVGLGQFYMAYTAKFKQDMKRAEMTEAQENLVGGLGRLGFVARGVTFTLVGWFVFQAGLHRDPARVRGFGGAFMFLLSQPNGRLLLGLVALGFIALGLHSFAAARWMRLLGSRR